MVGYVISHISEEVCVDVIKGIAKRRKCFKMEGVTTSLEFWGTEKHGQRAVSSLETQIAPQEHFEWVVGVGSWLQRTEARGQRGGEGTEPLRFSLVSSPRAPLPVSFMEGLFKSSAHFDGWFFFSLMSSRSCLHILDTNSS